MIVYVLSSPTEDEILLTANLIVAQAAQQTADDMVMTEWDTEKTPMASIRLNFVFGDEAAQART